MSLNDLVWKEPVDNESPESHAFGWGDSQATLALDVPADQLQRVPGQLLGYPRWDRAAARLRRTLPARHPIFPWLVATKITSIRGRQFNKKDFGPTGLPFASYNWFRLMVLFTVPEFEVLGDGEVTYEHQRYTEWDWQPGLNVYQLPAGSLKWADGPFVSNLPFGGRFQSAINVRAPAADLVVTWHQVPHEGLFNASMRLNPNITNGLGKVNDSAWPGGDGNPAETMLLTGVKLEREVAPVAPSLLGLADTKPARTWRVKFALKFSDPPLNPANTSYRGWAVFPAPGGANGSHSGYYYLATRDGSTDNGARLYPQYPFNTLFQLV